VIHAPGLPHMIEASGISKAYPRHGGGLLRALHDVSLAASAGKVIGILGPNGAGKTTLFRILCGLVAPEPGACLTIMGQDAVSHPAAARARCGLLTQQPDLPPRVTPIWHVSLMATLHGMERPEAVRRAERILEEIGLGDLMRQPMATLSKGNRQRVALARALAHSPDVLLLDEPTAGLDIAAAAWLRAEIARRAAAGCAVLLATHNPLEAAQLCDRILILRRGRIVAQGTLEAVCRQSRAAAGLAGAAALEAAYLELQEEGA